MAPLGAHTMALLALVTLAATSLPAPLGAQGMRGWVGTTVQVVELRPFGQDTVSKGSVVSGPDGEYLFDGRPISCFVGDFCTRYVALDEDQLLAVTQDLSLTAWGFGMEGLSFTTLLRFREHAGSDLLWPRSDDAFDALLGYAQLLRGSFRLRLGRQEVRSGLGFPAFDGGSVTYGTGRTEVGAFGGRSLARGLRQPANEALRGIEDFLVDESAYLVGASVRTRLTGAVFTARYQREMLADRSGLVGERGSLDFATTLSRVRVNGSADYDFAFERLGKSHLSLGVPLRQGRVLVEASARRYVPYFQLNTIWGFFEPVSYTELEVRGSWAPDAELGVWASLGRRSYEDTETQSLLGPLTDTGWRTLAGVRWQPSRELAVDGSYRMEWGPGAFLSSGDLAVRYDPWDRLSLSLSGTTFQQVEEFRVGDGRAFGGGASFDLSVTDKVEFSGGASVLRHRDGGSAFTSPWNQVRAWTSLRLAVGSDPGLSDRRGGR